jgi:hypothetical protein
MSTSGGHKIQTLNQMAPGATVTSAWRVAAEVTCLNAWPVVVAGATGSAEITKITYLKKGNPSERFIEYTVKNTGTTTINVNVWEFWWNS